MIFCRVNGLLFVMDCWITLIHYQQRIIIYFCFLFFQADKKGCSATEYGFVFGSFELVAFVTSPVFGSLVSSMHDLYTSPPPHTSLDLGIRSISRLKMYFRIYSYI